MNEVGCMNEISTKDLFTQFHNYARSFIKASDLYNQIAGIINFLILAFLFLLFAYLIFSFKKRLNNKSNNQIEKFKAKKKYIPELYIELNDNMEYLRHFLYPEKWKNKIVKRFNTMFDGVVNHQILKSIDNRELQKIIPRNIHFDKLCQLIQNRKEIVEQNINLNDKMNTLTLHERFFRRNNLYYTPDELDYLFKLCSIEKSNSMVIVGSAGNGKTNLLCHAVSWLMKNGSPCLFIDARDIDSDCYEYITRKILPMRLLPWRQVYYFIISSIQKIRGKNIYIIIDAINENDTDIFSKSLSSLVDQLSRYKNIKLLFSCRSEYFSVRYERLFENCCHKPYILELEQSKYTNKALRALLNSYQQYFHVKGTIAWNVFEKLTRSLLLMRIFFEVNQNQTTHTLELQDAEIFKRYFEKVELQSKPFEFRQVIRKISEIMITQCKFDKVILSDLQLSTQDLKNFKAVLDDNLIISKSVIQGEGITERNSEYVYFVFDELRDYCLARYVLIQSEENNDTNYKIFFSLLDKLQQNKHSPFEGIIKYGYYYFKQIKHYSLCTKILDQYSDIKVSSFENFAMHNKKYLIFHNFGLSLIFQSGKQIAEFEESFIVSSINDNPHLVWNIARYLLQNDLADIQPGSEIIVNLLLKKIPYNTICESVNQLLSDRYDRPLYNRIYQNEKRKIEYILDAADMLNHKKDSVAFKSLLIIIAGIDPSDPFLDKLLSVVTLDDIKRTEYSSHGQLKKNIKKLRHLYEAPDSEYNSIEEIISNYLS